MKPNVQKGRNHEDPGTIKTDHMQPNRLSIFEKFVSPKLAWYYNKHTNTWSVVYKIKQSRENPTFWVVCDCNQKCFAANSCDLHLSPPNDMLSIEEVIALTMKSLHASLAQNNVCMLYVTYSNSIYSLYI